MWNETQPAPCFGRDALNSSRTLSCVVSVFLIVTAIVSLATAQTPGEPAKPARWGRPTAEEVSRQFLARHPKPRDEAEKRIIAVMDDMFANQSQGMGNVLPEDGRLMRMLAMAMPSTSRTNLTWFSCPLMASAGITWIATRHPTWTG